ncbi:MAG: NnrS family protein [Motiliproteus sp.]|nr:NnrS family protein [Motiliproteus sp.]MCW9051341.1 NnrS family protein [Motiliproteus sp.]
MLNIERPEDRIPEDAFALFFLGFRPFFSMAGVSAVILMLIWLPFLGGHVALNDYYGVIGWHGHEMLFGYSLAVIAGFLLTAVRNWTSMEVPSGAPLIGLTLVWLAGRVLSSIDFGQPDWLTMGVDLAFVPLVMLGLAKPLLAAKVMRNIAFLAILTMFFIANLLMHLQAIGAANTGALGMQMGLSLVILVIVVLGGRVIPFFTRNPLPGMEPRQWPLIEIAAVAGVVLIILLDLLQLSPMILAVVSIIVAVIHYVRMSGWYDKRIWSHPIIWVLHVAYCWIATGFLLKGLAGFQLVSLSAATHAFTVGGIGMITLGMMGRVSLGHTGRMLELPRQTVWGIFILAVAAVVRVAAGFAIFAGAYNALIGIAALLWAIAFALFSYNYIPYLLKPRVDGRPG